MRTVYTVTHKYARTTTDATKVSAATGDGAAAGPPPTGVRVLVDAEGKKTVFVIGNNMFTNAASIARKGVRIKHLLIHPQLSRHPRHT